MTHGPGGKTTPGSTFHNLQNENSTELKCLKNEFSAPAQNAAAKNSNSTEKPTAAQNAAITINKKKMYEVNYKK